MERRDPRVQGSVLKTFLLLVLPATRVLRQDQGLGFRV